MKKFVRDENGQALALFALLVTVLLGFTALAIDTGMMTFEKAKLQKAADAAALAGAQDLPAAGNATSAALDYAGKNGLKATQNGIKKDGDIVTVTTPYKGKSSEIEVVLTRSIQHTFARILGLTGSNITVRAVARNAQWNGEALPFINLAFDYSSTDPVAWTKVGPGVKGTLTDFYTRNSGSDNLYFELDYKDGLSVTPGYANGTKGLDSSKLKDGLEVVLTPADMGIKKVYLFSLKADIIQKKEFTVNNKTKTVSLDELNRLGNGDVIDPDQLVLIECLFIDCKWANRHDIELTYLNKVYDLGNDDPDNPLPDFPADGISYGNSRLVE